MSNMEKLSKSNWLWHVMAVLIPFIVYAFLFNKYSYSDFSRSMALSGDGMKGLFYFVDYIRNGHNFYVYGSNYPYGEFIPFTDNMPIVAVIFKFINDHIVSIKGHELALHNLFLFFQWTLSGYVFYLVFRRLNVHHAFSILSAFCILILSPQIERYTGHYGLALILAISLFFLFTLNIIKEHKIRQNGIFLFILCFIATFIHVYNLLFLLVFGVIMAIIVFFKKKRQVFWGLLIPLLFSGAVSFSLIKMLDNREDRSKAASGYGIYNTTFEGVFYPNHGRVKQFIKERITKSDYEPHIEGQNYLGIQNIIFLLVFLGLSIRALFKKNKRDLFILKEPYIYFFWPAIFCWIYSLGVFTDIQISLFPNLHTPLNQFRSLGRLMWMTYCGLSICTLSWLYLRIKNLWSNKQIPFAIISAVLVGVIWISEGITNTRPVLPRISESRESIVFNPKESLRQFFEDNDLDKEDFQATLILPLVNRGSEKIRGETDVDWFLNYGYLARFELGIPSLPFVLQRTSIDEGCSLSQLLSSSFISKERLIDMDERDILVLESREKITDLDRKLISKGTYLGSLSSINIHRLPISAFDHEVFSRDSIFNTMESLNSCGQLYSDNCNQFIFYSKPLEKGNPVFPDIAHLNNGDESFEFEIHQLIGNKMEFTAWYNLSRNLAEGPDPKVEIIDKNGNILEKVYYSRANCHEYINNWRRLTFYIDLEMYQDAYTLRHSFIGKDQPVRNILFRKLWIEVGYPLSDSIYWKNNNFLHLEK